MKKFLYNHYHHIAAAFAITICFSSLSYCKDNCDCDKPVENCIFYNAAFSETSVTSAKIQVFVSLYLFLGSVELPMLILKPKGTMSESTTNRAWSSFIARLELVFTIFIPSVCQILVAIPQKNTTLAIALYNTTNILLITAFSSLLKANRAQEWTGHFHPQMFGTLFSLGAAVSSIS